MRQVIVLILTAVILMAMAACLLFLVLIVVSIHRVDHAKGLMHTPRGRTDTMTRHVLGLRAFSPNRDGRRS